MAEECQDPTRIFPKILLTGLGITGLIYILVSISAITLVSPQDLGEGETPLLKVVQAGAPNFPLEIFGFITMFAVANSALINMMSAAVSTLMVSGALAQANPPAAPPAAPAAKADAGPVDSAKFIQAQGTDQWVFSKFKGTDVIGPDNAQVGDVNDVLFDKGGKIIGLIVGVGGFLGIGEKSVAIDMKRRPTSGRLVTN